MLEEMIRSERFAKSLSSGVLALELYQSIPKPPSSRHLHQVIIIYPIYI